MSNVYFSDMRSHNDNSPLNKVKKLAHKAGIADFYKKGDLVALKLHFGEFGNTAFLRPIYLRPILETLHRQGAKPFLTDTNTLYVGMRANSVDHLHNATLNGFNYSTLQTPVIIGDGLRGEAVAELPIPNGINFKTAKIGEIIANADKLFVISHFKGHEMTGFGGAVKNLAMGCAARVGKHEMHSSIRPEVNVHKCTACGRCKKVCQAEAITISNHATISDKCVGCAMCINSCPEKAIDSTFSTSCDRLQQNIAEYAYAVHNHFKGEVVYINILTSIVPACDCHGGNDAPMVHDIGFMASSDPVALDKACFDKVLEVAGENVFKKAWDYINTDDLFKHCEKLGFGSTNYTLESVK